ncbi:MAG TPA: hypothetical protein VK886_03065 [Vicinamibacterales bacterium]|nr:hypothetical protein [Vicinamibacterales bacterium]
MKGSIGRTALIAALALIPAATASAQNGPACSPARVAGDWGYTATGTLILPTGPVPFALVGKMTGEPSGDFSGTQDSSAGGNVATDTLLGTATVNADCTGAVTVNLYDAEGHLLRTATYATVYVDNAKELRGIMTSLTLADGTRVPTVVTLEAKRVFTNRRNQP